MSAVGGDGAAFLTAEWRHLAMLNYAVDPAVLAPRVPAGVVLDLYEGHALVSIVAFRFLRTRLLGLPVPGHVNFDEVNLRFYVRRELPDGEVRRGVTFVRELVPRHAIAAVARLAYNEPYAACPMRSSVRAPAGEAPGRLHFAFRPHGEGRRWQSVDVTTVGEPLPMAPGSETEFVAEHYWGYTPQRDGGTVEYRVEHPRWRTWAVRDARLDVDVAALYGPEFVEALGVTPRSAFAAEGSPVRIRFPRRLPR